MSTPEDVSKVLSSSGNNLKSFKVIVLGDSNVGKTSLTYRFCEGNFLEAVEATIGVDFRERTLTIDGESIKLQLWDTAGQERFRKSMVKHYYRNANAIVLVYDVTNRNSFLSLRAWIAECDINCTYNIPRIMVGNKCDEVAQVNTNEAQRFADEHGMPLFETSAWLDSQHDNVEAIFVTLAHKLKSQRPLIPKPRAAVMVNQHNLNTKQTRSSCGC